MVVSFHPETLVSTSCGFWTCMHSSCSLGGVLVSCCTLEPIKVRKLPNGIVAIWFAESV